MNPIRMIIYLLVLCCVQTALAQGSDGPTVLTPAAEKKIKKEIEDAALKLKYTLSKDEVSAFDIEFTIDTFRVEQLMEKHIGDDYSTMGMRQAAYTAAHQYDSLLNKYYRKLLSVLKPADKANLIQAQKSWIVYRDNEIKLIRTLSRDEYSGGGTVQ